MFHFIEKCYEHVRWLRFKWKHLPDKEARTFETGDVYSFQGNKNNQTNSFQVQSTETD